MIDRLHVRTGDASMVAGYVLGSAGIGLIAAQSVVGRLRAVALLQWLRWGALAGGMGFVSTLAAPAGYPMLLCASYFVAACGMGAAFPAVAALASTRVEAHEQAACAGTMSMAQGLSMVVAPLAGTMLYELHLAAPFVSIGVVLAAVCVATCGVGARSPAA